MQRGPTWLKRAATGVVAGLSATLGLSVLAVAAHADSTFGFNRVAGVDRYGTACAIATSRYNPNGSGSINTVLLADGLPGHQSDALASPYLEQSIGAPILLTDNTSTVPSNTMTCLSTNKVKNIIIIGGTNAISSAQISQLTSAGYTISKTYAGSDRYDTARQIDEAVAGTPGGAPTGILASGEDNHLVDALGAGPLSYGQKFPMLLTTSSGCTLPTATQDAITKLGIKKVIVVGGTAAVPACQYTSFGTNADTSATSGANRAATAELLAKDEVANYGGSNQYMGLAAGATYVGQTTTVQNDGADALASAPLVGNAAAWNTAASSSASGTPPTGANVGTEIPLLVTDNPTDCTAAADFAGTEKATLHGNSPAFGGSSPLPQACVNSVISAGGGTPSTTQGFVTAISPTSGAPGSTVTLTVNGTPTSISVTGCGMSNTPATPASSNTAGGSTSTWTITIPQSVPTGTCTLTFTATNPAGSNPATTTSTQQFTVTPAANGACVTAPSSATQTSGSETPLPQLCSAKVVSTNVAGNPAGAPVGTTVQYVFSQKLTGDVLTAGGFHVFDASNNRYDPASATIDSSNPNAADVFYNNPNASASSTGGAGGAGVGSSLQTTTGAANLTLATVGGPGDVGGAAVTAPAGGSPDGATAIGTASTTNAAGAGVTTAPNPDSWTIVGAAASGYPNSTTISIGFDKNAFVQSPVTCGPAPTACTAGSNYPPQYPGGGSPAGTNPLPAAATQEASQGFDIVLASTATATPSTGNTTNEIQCYGPPVSNVPGGAGYTSSGGQVPGGNGSQTLTIVCPNSVSGPTATSATLTTAQIARVIVQSDAVGTVAPAAGTACPGGPATGAPGSSSGVATGAGTGNDICNPMSAADAPRNTSDSPDLTNVQFFPSTTAAADQIVYTFDEPVGTTGTTYNAAIAGFMFYRANGTTVTCSAAATPPTATPTASGTAPCTAVVNGSNFQQVIVTVGTTAGAPPTGAGQTANATGASVANGTVTGATGTAGHTNADDEFGAANPNNAGTTQTPGSVNAPQVISVHVTATTNPVTGATTYSATYTFNGPVVASPGPALAGAKFHLYDSDGTFMSATGAGGGCSIGTSFTSTPNNSQVTCTGYAVTASPTGQTGAPSGSQISSATLGTVDYAAVAGNATVASGAANPAAGNVNPEGGVKTS